MVTVWVRVEVIRDDDRRSPFVVQRPLRDPYRDAATEIRVAAEDLVALIVRDGLTMALDAN